MAAYAIVLAFTAASPAEPVAYAAPARASLERLLSDVVTWKLTPSISLAIVENGKVVYAGARGTANLEKSMPATVETRYPIGSIGTLFLAVAVMQLDVKGRLHLDDPVKKYLPDMPDASVSVRQLLAPREDDENYDVLGNVIERAAAVPLVSYLYDHVFAPAGMDHTWFGEPPDWAPLAAGYYEWRDVFGLTAPQTDAWNRMCCSFSSTATDLARFDSALFEGKLLPAASLRVIRQAFRSTRQAGKPMIVREGTPSGYVAGNALFMDDRFAVVALTNCDGFPAQPVLDPVLTLFYPKAVAANAPSVRADAADTAIAGLLRPYLASWPEPLGRVRAMTLLSSSVSEGFTEYRYLVDFSGGTKTAFIVVGSGGKADGFWLH
ncbi:MAG TPA: serine hydrolase domain-containing protein [Candidatus Cybelea sp.]|nr:serine hydrolase domain-containing protein [Candidatus Cybelea sp.]